MMYRLAAFALMAVAVRAYSGPCSAELQCFLEPLELPWTVETMDAEKLIGGLEECMDKHGCKPGESQGGAQPGGGYWRIYYDRALKEMKERGSFEPTECERNAALDAGQSYGQCLERSSTVGDHLTNKTKKLAMAMHGCGPMKVIQIQQCLITEKSGITQEQLAAVQQKAREFANKEKMQELVCKCFGPENMSTECSTMAKSAATEVCDCVQPLMEQSLAAVHACHNGTEHSDRAAKFEEIATMVKKHTAEVCSHSDEIIEDVLSRMCDVDSIKEVIKKWHDKSMEKHEHEH